MRQGTTSRQLRANSFRKVAGTLRVPSAFRKVAGTLRVPSAKDRDKGSFRLRHTECAYYFAKKRPGKPEAFVLRFEILP